jgi:RNA recognition motif-containing protein
VKLFVCNIPWFAAEADFALFLDKLGYVVREVKIAYDEDQRRSRGYGFVTFETQTMYEQALRDLGGEEFKGRELRVAPAIEKRRNGGSRPGGSRGRRDRREAREGESRKPEAPDDFGWEDVS